MKDLSTTKFNIESRLVQKGVLDLKGFWQFLEDKYFKPPENKNIDLLSQLKILLIKNSELPFCERKDPKESISLSKFYEEIYQEGLKTSKFIF